MPAAIAPLFIAALALEGAPPGDIRRTAVVSAVERVSPAVVNIATEQLVARREDPSAPYDPLFEEFFRDFGEARLEERWELASLGSGTIIDPRGYVLTNEHVVTRASRIKVLLADKREFEARVVGTDPASDLAVLKIHSSERLPAVPLGTSSDLVIGETLIVIGNPFGLSHSVTTGVLSARSRTVRAGERSFGDFLQTDAAINPGNSGGPILNLEGNVVGIATAIYAGGHGIGFAIPVDRARGVVEAIVNHGTVAPFWIGADAKPIPDGLGQALGLAPGIGLVVTQVVASSPAEQAGLRAGDVLTAAAGRPLASVADLDGALASRSGSGSTRIDFVRDGRPRTVTVHPLEAGSPRLVAIAEGVLGLKLTKAPDRSGLIVSEVVPGGRAARRGIVAGDRLHELDGQRLDGLESLRAGFYKALSKRSALLLVERDGAAWYAPITLE